MAVTIIANGHLGTLKKQRVSTNSTSVQLSKILNDANIIPPVTNEPGKVFSFWGTTINGFDIGGYTINQLYSIGAITKDGILNIYANYSYAANNIQITFNANGGKFADGTTTKVISVPLGSIYAELESNIDLPTLSGKAFKSWTDPSNTVINGYSEFSEAIILTAQWETATNVNITAKDSRGKSVISGSYPKSTLWKDLYAQAVSNGYTPDDTTKPFSKILPGYGSYTGQAVKKIDFSVANNPMLIGWLRGSIYDAGRIQVPALNSKNQSNKLYNTTFLNTSDGWWDRGLYGKNVALDTRIDTDGHTIVVKKDNSPTRLQSKIIPVQAGKKISFSVNTLSAYTSDTRGLWIYVNNVDSNGNLINFPGTSKSEAMTVIGKGNISSINYVIPEGVQYISFGIMLGGQVPNGDIFKDPILVFDDSVGEYVDGQKPALKIRDFSSTNIPVDPSTTFSVTGKSSAALALTYNPLDMFDYSGNENILLGSNVTLTGGSSDVYKSIITDKASSLSGKKIAISMDFDYDNIKAISGRSRIIFELGFYDTISKSTKYVGVSKTFTSSDVGTSSSGRITSIFDATGMVFDNQILSSTGMYIQGVTADSISIGNPQMEASDTATKYSPSPRDNKPGLWLNDDWLYNPYTQKWLDSSLDRTDFTYSNAVITFKDYFNVQYVTGDISKVRSSVVATVKSVVAGYGSTTDKHALYSNSYFPNSDSGVTLKVEEYLGYSYIIFYNPSSGYYQKVYQQAGTKYSEFLKLISKSKFDINGKFMKGFYVSNYWANSKLIAGMPINAPIEYAFSGYLDPNTSTFVRISFDANGGTFYKGTSYETSSITMEVSPLDTYGVAINYLPDISKRTLDVLFWVMDLVDMEPAYPLTVTNGQTLYPKWTITDKVELYRKPREYYLIDLDSVYNGWDMMDKFSLSDKNNIFVIDPTGTGVSYSEDNAKSNSNGWSKYDRGISSNAIEFEAYYNGYDQYNRLGRWIRGKELVLAMLNETGVPTYWTVDIAEIERTEIKYGEDLLHGKISFNKTSPAFDLEFIGLGTDNTIDNSDDMFRRNAYVYIHSLRVPDADKGIQIIATNGETTIEDAVDVDLPAGSYFEYSTLPFRELWKYGSSWNNLTNNLYNNIIDLVGARPIKVGIGKWDISVSSSNKVLISSLAPHKIQDYAGKTIDSLGGLGPFTGIAIKEKEL